MRVMLLSVVLCTACAGNSLDAARACNDLASARCSQLATCSPADLQKRWPDLQTCIEREQLGCEQGLTAPSSAATPTGVEACAEAIPSSTCESLLARTPPAVCLAPMGSAADGTACAVAAQCASAFCAIASDSLCGTCAPAPVAGASCATTGCGPAMTCVATTQQCQPLAAAGAACSRALPCAEGLACVGSTASVVGSCMPAVAIEGAPCDSTRRTGPDCSSSAGFTCNTMTNQCVVQPIVAAGLSCGVIDGVTTRCAAGASCDPSTGANTSTCTAPAADGAVCDPTSGPGCEAPARCIAGTCQLPASTSCS